jgi:ABC-type transporter Mla subunit MlaD
MGMAVSDERLARRVGAGVLVLLGVAVVTLVFADACRLRAGVTVHVYFEHMVLEAGAPVQVAGRVVGEVSSVDLVPARLASEPDHLLHPHGGVALAIRVERRRRHMAPQNGEYFVSSKGVLGERYLEIGPPAGGAPWTRPIRDGDRVRGIDPPQMDRVLQRTYENLLSTRDFLDAIAPEARALVGALDRLSYALAQAEPAPGAWGALGAAAGRARDELAATRTAWAAAEVPTGDLLALPGRARATLAALEAGLADTRAHLAVLGAEINRLRASIPADLRERLEMALRQTDESLARVERTAATARELLAMVERGQGTLGALANDPEFSDDAKQLGKLIKTHPWRLVGRPRD